MRSSRPRRSWVLPGLLLALGARAQTPVEGWNSERLYPSAPGAGWFVMDTLDMHGELGGVLAFTGRYAQAPVRVSQGGQSLTVVTDAAYAQVAGAVTWRAWRFSVAFDFPFVLAGRSGTLGKFAYTAPDVNLGTRPDTISDVRIGVDTRLVGDANGPFRLGLGAQLWIPSGDTTDFVTDGTYRAMARVLVAGDVRWLTYAGQLGVHVRPRDDGGIPGAPRGSELLFGVAAGGAWAVGQTYRAVLGPEVYGATALAGFFQPQTTTAEALLSGRVEGTGERGPQLRFKLGGGVGLNSSFGSPVWRVMFS
ncbi:MAG TPA: hypothetical protein VLQ79_12125, partial [Myxococcaceae bacterium]|nr:hypothetical protein [Myxococcaceae bacterium]